MRLIAAALLLFTSSSACAERPEEIVASGIRSHNSPVVASVDSVAANVLDVAEVHVVLHPGATPADAARLWCEAVAPAGGKGEFDGPVHGDVLVILLDPAGSDVTPGSSPRCP